MLGSLVIKACRVYMFDVLVPLLAGVGAEPVPNPRVP